MRPSSRTARDAAAGTHTAATRLEMRLVDEQGNVIARANEPFEVGRFDLAAARQGMRKMLLGMGRAGEEADDDGIGTFDA